MPIETYTKSPWLAPFAIRKLRVRTDPHVSGPARDLWGFPDLHGRFTDDNSLIKGATRGRVVQGKWSPYGASKLSTGMVCCHVWPNSTGDAELFSFVPNLVWLPRTIAGLSDAHFKHREPHRLHFALREISVSRYKPHPTAVGADRARQAWEKLPSEVSNAHWAVSEMSGGDRLAKAALVRTSRVIEFLDEIEAGRLPQRRVSKRYHAGVGARIDLSLPAVQSFVSARDLRMLANDLKASIS